MKAWKRILILTTLAGLAAAYATGCGSGVEFGAKKFTLRGAGS